MVQRVARSRSDLIGRAYPLLRRKFSTAIRLTHRALMKNSSDSPGEPGSSAKLGFD